MPQREDTVPSLNSIKTMTEQGLDEDDVRRRDEEQRLIVSIIRTILRNSGGTTLVR